MPKFGPMINPHEMVGLGVWQGNAVISPNAQVDSELNWFKVAGDHHIYWGKMQEWYCQVFNPEYLSKTAELELVPFAPYQWFIWFDTVYYKSFERENNPMNSLMVEFWRRAVWYTFESKKGLEFTSEQKQTLLDLGWNADYSLNFKLT